MSKPDPNVLDADALASLRELVDRQAIFDCMVRYSRGIDRLDRELTLSAYHPDAIDDHGEYIGSPEGLFDFAYTMNAPVKLMTHHRLTNHSCQIEGDIAHAETYYLYSAHKSGDEAIRLASGRYIDKLERRNRAWKIALRYCVVEWASSIPATAVPFENVPNVHSNGVPSHGRADPSYRRPLSNNRPLRNPVVTKGSG